MTILQPMKEWEMYLVLGIFLATDVITLVSWQVIDPLFRELEYFPPEDPASKTQDDIKLKPELEHCSSKHLNIWLGEHSASGLDRSDTYSSE